ncbi:MAG: virulence protein [Acetobacterium sp. MES1]|uniref:Virulence protein n=1 Tax=Acetobacterium wieringae TaxID=52694 RepID=A0A5D0WQI9_9FIRM|nr:MULTISPECIES: virulence protein [Acetobacterium]OXS26589.1 MAG: virulence protein [Acetobacterium sp. MES1]TYC86500.1 virulence protein [Acetobacterium wieringae]
MTMKYQFTDCDRKTLVATIGEILQFQPIYQGVPSFAYTIGSFEVDKQGTLVVAETTLETVVDSLLENLREKGFTFEKAENPTENESDDILVIEIPKEGFTDEAMTNLENLITGKGELIKKALGIEALSVEQSQDTISFPWFKADSEPEAILAYTQFIAAICEMAKTQKRISSIAKTMINEKYAFRCFLLRLGFIGDEYKTTRKILLSKLSGSAAFKSRKKSDTE